MRQNDRAMISRVWPKWFGKIGKISSALLHAPDPDEYQLIMMECGRHAIKTTQRDDWDIGKQKCPFPSDLIVMSNVFMYSPDPAAWFDNVLSSCKYMFMLDHVRSQRGADVEFGSDGDCCRFSFMNEHARVPSCELENDRVISFIPYDAPREGDRTFVALLQGDVR